MTLHEMIYHRKSCRSFTGKPVEPEMIERILSFDPKPLYPEIKVRMDIVSRTYHYFRVTYLPPGQDATVSWPEPDFKFRNDRDYPVKIVAWCDNDNAQLTIQIWGTDTDGSYVTLRQTSEPLYDGMYTSVLVAYKVRTFRDVYDADGNLLETISEPFGTYHLHDEDIDWPPEKYKQEMTDFSDPLDLLEKEMARLKELGHEREWQRQYIKYKYLKPLVDDLEVQLNGEKSVG